MKRLWLLIIILVLFAVSGDANISAPPHSETVFSSIDTESLTAIAAPQITSEVPTGMPDLAAMVVAVQQLRLYESYPSPDGEWRAEVYVYECVKTDGGDEIAYERLKLIHITSGKERIADDQLQYCGGAGAFGLEGMFWSSNSRYFYYTNAREGVPGGCGYWERPIVRLDIISLNKDFLGAGFLSPDGERIAAWQERELGIWDVNDGEIARIPASAETETGPLAWSPDSQALVYVQFASACPLSGKSSLVLVDVLDLEQMLLLESEKPTFGNVIWRSSDSLTLFDENSRQWIYGFTTQQLLP